SFSFLPLPPPISTPFPYTTLFRSVPIVRRLDEFRILMRVLTVAQCTFTACKIADDRTVVFCRMLEYFDAQLSAVCLIKRSRLNLDRKSTRLNSGHVSISYAVFCLK